MTTARYLAIDPGVRNGWATFSANGTLLRRGVLIEEPFFMMLNGQGWQGVQVVIIEKFALYPGMDHRLVLSTMPAAEMIGAVRSVAYMRGWEIHLQGAQQMRAAIQWLGYTYSPKSHVPDQIAAHGHGVYYLEKQNILDIARARKDKEEYESRAKGSTSSG